MLEFFSIFSKGGIVLWLLNFSEDPPNASLNSLISDVILEEKSVNAFSHDKVKMEYAINNCKDIILVAAYKKVLDLPYIHNMIKRVESEFCSRYDEYQLEKNFGDFEPVFRRVLDYYEEANQSAHFPESVPVEDNSEIVAEEKEEFKPLKTEKIVTPSQLFVNNEAKKSKNKKKTNQSPKKKVARTWGDDYNDADVEMLDFSEKPSPKAVKSTKATKAPVAEKNLSIKPLNSSQIQEAPSGVFGYFKTLIGSNTIDERSLLSPMNKMRDHLIAKNVAADIADQICQSVSDQLLGKSLSSFQSVSSILRSCIEESLTKILTPKSKIQILDLISQNKTNRPFVIVFCGVNGVGKSTNLAKIAYYLLSNNQKVLIAACDTFRSGAVEQLRTHVARFNDMFPGDTPRCVLFDKGYGKDASGVAAEAIKTATGNFSVVLIDTAGRMQNNGPLMRSLAKLMKTNNPDLVLFVGEALVGNDGVDQLLEFDKRLTEYSDSTKQHLIDGIILTKFDTIDDKVGAAISMTYVTGQPIVFIGVGQTYKDLRLLDVPSIVNLLLR